MTFEVNVLKGRIESNYQGYAKLAEFYESCYDFQNCKIDIDLSQLRWIDANLCGLWLAMIRELASQNNVEFYINKCHYQNSSEKEAPFSVLFRNGFLPAIMGLEDESGETRLDDRESTIAVKYFTVSEVDAFVDYVETEFLNHRGCRITNTDKEELSNAYFELFANYELHAQTQAPVYVCGQFYPQKHQLIFTMNDLGVGFLKNISTFTEGKIDDPKQAIEWALKKGNSTKKEAHGGSGLSIVDNFCRRNKGALHIITDKIYAFANYPHQDWQYQNLENAFIGTTIHLVFPIW